MGKFKNDYHGRKATERNVEDAINGKFTRMDKLTYEESREWLDSVRLDMDEDRIVTRGAKFDFNAKKDWLISKGFGSDRAMNMYLHDPYARGAILSVNRISNIHKKCFLLMGYEDRKDVPDEKLHELNMMIIDEFRKLLNSKGVTIIEP